ncbi:unnamed protein product, partial [Tilletia caries]
MVWVPPPSDIVVDCSTTEQAAINRAFNHLPTPPRILLCQWHVLRAWEDNIKDKIRVLSLEDDAREKSQQLQSRCRADLRLLVYAETPARFDELMTAFEAEWSPAFSVFVAYFKREWVTKRPPSLWSMAFRQ